MSELIREFFVQGSEPSPYKVRFKKDGDDLKATCSCRAGISGMLCKHRLSILDGDKSAVISNNTEQVAEVYSWLQGSKVTDAISEVVSLEAQKKQIEATIKRAKKNDCRDVDTVTRFFRGLLRQGSQSVFEGVASHSQRAPASFRGRAGGPPHVARASGSGSSRV